MKHTPESFYLQNILNRNKQIEMRCIKDGVIQSGVFDDYAKMVMAIRFAESQKYDSYVTVNPVSADIPASNKIIKPKQGESISDKDISLISAIPFDLDPIRETGMPSSNDEIREAKDRADYLYEFLYERGWGEPVIGFSGNGFHLVYFTVLPNNEQTKASLRDLYLGLKLRFTDDLVNFDTTVRNPSRILRLYGTTNQKSGKQSKVYATSTYKNLPANVILDTAKEVAPPPPAKPTYLERKKAKEGQGGIKYIANFDVVNLFKSLGLYKRQLDAMKHAVTCLWCDTHSSPDDVHKTDCVIWEGKWPQYHCSHDHCHDKNILDVFKFLGVSHAA